MMKLKNILILLAINIFLTTGAWANDVWINDLRSLFLSNNAIIYAINMRTFNAKDLNKNGIIEEDIGEERGSFLNAIDRLDELKTTGVNTIHLLPITSVGKVKALGTAGSLYSAASFNELNPQLKSDNKDLTINEEAKRFIDECHNRKIRVIVDMPSCGSYDLYLKNPDIFKKDKNQNPIIPADWTDVRLLDAGTNANINMDVYNLYQGYIDLMILLGVDGVRADVATIKPYTFWKKLIDETRMRNPQFLFLAEASDSWKEPPSEYAVFTPYNKLLEAGFDGYYGSFFNLKDWKTAPELISHIKTNNEICKKYPGGRSAIGSFTTHDILSPILINGAQYSKMIVWLNSTLPLNAYYIDGFPTGDDYIYPWANKKAAKTFTDDDYYFTHRGQLDIFNFSRKPMGNRKDILQEFILGNKFKIYARELVSKGSFVPLKTSSEYVFAYARSYNKNTLIVIGNLDFKKSHNVKVSIPKLTTELSSVPIRVLNVPKISNGKITTDLTPGDVQVLVFDNLELK